MVSKKQRMGGLSLSSFSKASSVSTDTTQDSSEKELPLEETSFLNLDNIQDRDSDTRELHEDHIKALCESIGAVGLIESLVVDRDGKLLAGGHRKAAIMRLRVENPEQYEQHFSDNMIPVRVMDFSAKTSPDLALEIEVSENEVRRDYSKEEVLAIAQRLRDAGYKDTPGKPKKGEKRLKPAIQTIIGKSMRTVERYLSNEKTVTPTNGEVSQDEISEADKHLQKAIAHLEKWQKTKGGKKREKSLMTKIDDILADLQEALE